MATQSHHVRLLRPACAAARPGEESDRTHGAARAAQTQMALGQVTSDDAPGAHNTSGTDRHPRADDHTCGQPGAVTDHDRSRPLDPGSPFPGLQRVLGGDQLDPGSDPVLRFVDRLILGYVAVRWTDLWSVGQHPCRGQRHVYLQRDPLDDRVMPETNVGLTAVAVGTWSLPEASEAEVALAASAEGSWSLPEPEPSEVK